MRRLPPPDRVTRPPPSMTVCGWVLTTFAVAVSTMVTGAGPQLNVITPPALTAATNAADVQPAGVPWPITWFGCATLAARAAAGIVAVPLGLPATSGGGVGFGLGFGLAVGFPVGLAPGVAGGAAVVALTGAPG